MISEARKKALLNGDMLLAVLDWVLAEQMAGRKPNDLDVARQFCLTSEEAELIHNHLEEIGEV